MIERALLAAANLRLLGDDESTFFLDPE